MTDPQFQNFKSQIRKGALDFVVLLIISFGPVYTSDILAKLKKQHLLVVEGTLYPLLTRLKNAGLLKYEWQESVSGPPRKYYSLTASGQKTLANLTEIWQKHCSSIQSLINLTHKK